MTYESQPVAYHTPDVAMPPTRPRGVTVVAIIGIVYGAMGVLCVGGGLLWNLVTTGTAMGGGGNAPNAPKINFPPEVQSFGAAAGAIGVLLSIMLLLGAIGLLGLKPWARTLLLAWAVVDLIYDIAKAIISQLWLNPKIQQAIADSGLMNNPQAAQIMKWSQGIGQIFGWLMLACIIALPIALLIVLNRPPAKAAFGVGISTSVPEPLPPLEPPAAV